MRSTANICLLHLFYNNDKISLVIILALVRSCLTSNARLIRGPTWFLKENIDLDAPFLCHRLNWSLEHGAVPSVFKSACVTPLLKKADLDSVDVKSYRPISNSSVTSKLLESVVSKQLVKYLKDKDLLSDLQSAYRAKHSTETVVLKVLADIVLALDSGDMAMLTLLDLSAAFDSIDHDILLRQLQISYGLDEVVN